MIRTSLVLALALSLAGCYSSTRPPRVNAAAPDFVLQQDGKQVALHDYKGKVVVLNFWATWCPPCVEEMPSLVQLQKQVKDHGVDVIAVSVDVDKAAYEKFLRDHHVDLTTVRDPDQKTNTVYGTFKFPETYIIDRKGIVQRKFIGPREWTDAETISYLNSL